VVITPVQVVVPTFVAAMRGARTKEMALLVGAILASLAYAASIILSEGEPALVALPIMLFVGGALVARPVFGVYLLFGAGILLEQWPIAGLDPLTARSHIFENISNYTALPLRLSVGDLLVVAALLSWLARLAVRACPSARRGPLDIAVAAYGAVFLFGVGIGVGRGGAWDLGAALAELRGPLYLVGLYVLCSQLIRTRRQVVLLVTEIVALVAVKAIQGVGNYIQMSTSPQWLDAVTGHEDVVFFSAIVVFAIVAMVLLPKQRVAWAIVALMPLLVAVEFLTQRRVAFIALGAALLAASALMLAVRPRRTAMILGATALAALFYGALFWDQQGLVAQPVRAVKAVIASDEVSVRDRMSDWWRDMENANIGFTVRQLPLTGVGVGQQYLFTQEPPQLAGFAYWRYWTHNAIFWVFLKAGPVGLFAFWLLISQTLVAVARIFVSLHDNTLRLVTALVAIVVVAQVVYSSVDLGLTFSRPMIVLGTLLGLVTTIRGMLPKDAHDVARTVAT
jgi:hypothetical protein